MVRCNRKDTAASIGPKFAQPIQVTVVAEDQATRVITNRRRKGSQCGNRAVQICAKHGSTVGRAVEQSVERGNEAARRTRAKIMEHLNRIAFLCQSQSWATADD